ncbi:unnamed protein product [Brassicogethes aeneus]|uniref:Uncharacterized protein n=1 Tax=Brassicogethes aeneus TaxID=1431903 RepID=A0A9P0FM35_BRAAE|nr:unnamed protein product [Brassicogethes aeneus]
MEPHFLSIKGITRGSCLISMHKFEADVEITGQRTRLTFAVVPAINLDYDVLIGCNLFFDTRLAAVTDCKGTKIINRQLRRQRQRQQLRIIIQTGALQSSFQTKIVRPL